MSEIQANQQVEEVKVQNLLSESHSVPSDHSEKVEETANLEISQFADSSIASSVAASQSEQQNFRISAAEQQQGQVSKVLDVKVEETATLVSSAIQEESAEKISVVEQSQPEAVKTEAPTTETQEVAQKQEGKVEVVPKGDEAKAEDTTVNPVDNTPPSPKIQRNEAQSPVLLSPRQSSRRSASPAVSRGKLETVNKMLAKEEDKARELQATYAQLTSKKSELEKALNEKIISQKSYKEKQEEEEKINQEKATLEKAIYQRAEELYKLKQKKQKQSQDHKKELERIQSQNKRLQAQVEAKKSSDHSKKVEHETLVSNAKTALQAENEKLANLQKEHNGYLSRKQEITRKINDLTNAKKAAQQKLTNSQKQKQEQSKSQQLAKGNILKRIAEVKEKINNKKFELSQVKSQTHDDLKNQHEKINTQINRVHALSLQLTETNKKFEEDLLKKSKENIENKQAQKKKEKRIIDLTKRSEDLTKKVSQFKEEIAKLDAQKQEKKVVRYEEKVPEEYLAIQAKNDALKKEIKKINERYEAEKAEMEKLVPPSVIENMNKKITAVIATNEKLTEVSKIIEDVTKENEKLAVEMDHLQWGENTHLKDLENERKKQEQKNKALEEQLQSKKKQLQQLSSKLEQYVKEYPDFKPEKKKKPEPQPEPKAKKEEKGGKKNDKSPPADNKKKVQNDAVIEPKVEEVKVEQPKSGKNKKKKGSNAPQIEKDQDPSPPPVEIKVEKNKVEVKPETKSEIKSSKKVQVPLQVKSEIKEQKAETKKDKKKKK